jgi:putative hydrolase of the HAD superfamily
MSRGVFFDLDDTLIRYRDAQREALAAAWCRTLGSRVVVDPVALQRDLTATYTARFAYGTPGYAELASITLRDLAWEVAAETVLHHGMESEADVERFIQAWEEEERGAFRVLPGALETLRALRAGGLTVGLITNGPSSLQREKLAMALGELFDVVVIDSEFGHPKPDRRIFDHAAAAAGLAPAELLFVGDSLPHDVAGARAAGWTAVWCSPSGVPSPPDASLPHYTVRSVADLLSLPPMAHLDLR